MSKKSKAQRDEDRRREAVRRMRLHTFIALLIPVMDAWEVGLKGGGQIAEMKYRAVELSPKEARYVKMQAGKVNKARDAVVRLLGLASFEKIGKNFYATADEKLQIVSRAIYDALPEDCPHDDEVRVLTYILYAAFHDLRILTNDGRPEVKRLVSALGCLADYLIPHDSHLVHPMSDVYWKTRDALQEDPDWTRGGEIEWGESAQDKYEKEQRKKDGR